METFSWLFNFIPWYVYVIIAIVLVAMFWQFISPIWLMLPRPVKVCIVFAGLIFTAYVAGRNRGSKDERNRNIQRDAQANNMRNDVHATIEKLDRAAVDRRLNKWLRD